MVYCDYLKNDEHSVTYAYGGDVEDITGEVVFYFNEEEIEVVSVPKTGDVHELFMKKLYGKYRNEFKKGIFKKKISYEI